MQLWEMSHRSFCSSRNFTGNHVEHESCGPFFFFFFPHTHTRLSRGTPFVFWGNMGRGALKLSEKTTKRKKKRLILLKFALVWNKKPICIRTKASLPHIKAVEGGSFVREKSHCSQSEAKTSKTSSILSPSR